jgi:cytochrome c556
MRKFATLAVCLLAGTLTCGVVHAEGPHDKAIKARQAMFQLYSFSAGVLGAMAKGEMEYDAALAQEMADNLNAAANLGQSAFWPPGSDNSNPDNMKNRALPKIWETFPAIGENAQQLKDAASVLAAEAGNGLDALRGSMGAVGKSCKGCHDEYRAKRR